MFAVRMDSTPALASRVAAPVAETVTWTCTCLLTLVLSLPLTLLPGLRDRASALPLGHFPQGATGS